MVKEDVGADIQFTGVSALDAMEQDTVQVLSREYYAKIKRQIQNVTNISVHVKCYELEGKRKKYSIHVKVAAPMQIFAADKAHSWELPVAIHEAFQDIQNQITHRLHNDTTRPDRPRI
jgi:ribosome-associated translation inhibitor RaiA